MWRGSLASGKMESWWGSIPVNLIPTVCCRPTATVSRPHKDTMEKNMDANSGDIRQLTDFKALFTIKHSALG